MNLKLLALMLLNRKNWYHLIQKYNCPLTLDTITDNAGRFASSWWFVWREKCSDVFLFLRLLAVMNGLAAWLVGNSVISKEHNEKTGKSGLDFSGWLGKMELIVKSNVSGTNSSRNHPKYWKMSSPVGGRMCKHDV